ncbi:cytochrome c biogenesis protein ResB [Paenibacillus woosongensis]|uniref:Cytochrome c biogenesis protein ResB n=1 Tax=Paenibacillus woosongensis TaxID=307580 RepID=A0AA95KZY2_9BACL|nr:cytochrome c biogenesis protein ResB [Paenibacillus woosongensis]WHX47409.1 cytochrome c biogenesis protein ResB [Paenibacillus woosongensis]
MIKNTKCECGHQNPVGTVLCEACGKPQYEEADHSSSELLEMRYDGVARRSQRANPNFIDKIWNFFSSVKVAVYLISITLVAAMLGTVFTQETMFVKNFDPSTYYKQKYGTIGEIYYMLGLSDTYNSWWFILLLVMIGASLVICSLDRVLPLYRALSKQKIRKHMQFLTRQRVVYQGPVSGRGEEWVNRAIAPLKKKGYRVHTDGGALLAEKQRFSRWGPYVIHIGLIVFLLAVLFRGLPGLHLDEHYWFPEGEITQIPDTNYYLKNEKFTVEYYTEDEMSDEFKQKGKIVPKLFETKAVLYQCVASCNDPLKEPELVEVDRHNIRVNDPLSYKGLQAYQFDFEEVTTLRYVQPTLVDQETGEVYGKFMLRMNDPETEYDVGPYHLKLKDKYLDFGLDENNKPITKSGEPNAPAFLFTITGPGLPEDGGQFIYFPFLQQQELFGQDKLNEALGGINHKLRFDMIAMEDVDFIHFTSFLNIRIDRAMPFVWTGLGIVMVGLIMGFYWQHRRIWLRIDDGILTLGGHTTKNWFGMRREVSSFLETMGIEVDEKSLDNGGNRS